MNTGNDILGQPALTTTQICKLLGFTVTAAFLENELGIPPDERTKTANLWLVVRFASICSALSTRVLRAGTDFTAEHLVGGVSCRARLFDGAGA